MSIPWDAECRFMVESNRQLQSILRDLHHQHHQALSRSAQMEQVIREQRAQLDQFWTLREEYENLQEEHQALIEEHDELIQDHQWLKETYDALENRYEALKKQIK